MKNNYVLFVSILLLITNSPYTYAMGDPLIVYSFLGAGFIQIVFLLSFYFLKGLKSSKYLSSTLYLLAMFPLWQWAVQFKGPDFSFFYLELYCVTIGIYLLIYFIVTKKMEKEDVTRSNPMK